MLLLYPTQRLNRAYRFLAHTYLELALYLYLDKVYHRLLVFIILADPGHDAFPSSGSKRADVLCETNSPSKPTPFLYIYIFISEIRNQRWRKNPHWKRPTFEATVRRFNPMFDPVKREKCERGGESKTLHCSLKRAEREKRTEGKADKPRLRHFRLVSFRKVVKEGS